MSIVTHRSPVAIAKDTVNLAKETGSPAFEKAAKWGFIAATAVTAIAGIAHAVKSLVKDFTGKPESGHKQRHAQVETRPAATAPEAPHPADGPQERANWVERTRAAESKPHHPRTHQHAAHGHGSRY